MAIFPFLVIFQAMVVISLMASEAPTSAEKRQDKFGGLSSSAKENCPRQPSNAFAWQLKLNCKTVEQAPPPAKFFFDKRNRHEVTCCAARRKSRVDPQHSKVSAIQLINLAMQGAHMQF